MLGESPPNICDRDLSVLCVAEMYGKWQSPRRKSHMPQIAKGLIFELVEMWTSMHISIPIAPCSRLVLYTGRRGTMGKFGLRKLTDNNSAPLSCKCCDSCQSNVSRLPSSGVLSCPRRGVLRAHHAKYGSVCCTVKLRVMAGAARSRSAEKLKIPLAPEATITAYGGTNWLNKWNAVEEAVGVVVDGRQHAGCLACCLSISGRYEGLYRRYVSHFTNNTPVNSTFAATSTRK
jgi:hypothetical protein